MAANLRLGHRVQLVRDGLQKAVALVAETQSPPFDDQTQTKLQWVLSQTSCGPLLAYYLKLIEPSGEPSTMEAFLPMFQPTLFSPMEGYFLLQQLASTPYCFVVLVSGNDVKLNRQVIFGKNNALRLRDMTSQLAATKTFLRQDGFRDARQWHMNNFDMKALTFD